MAITLNEGDRVRNKHGQVGEVVWVIGAEPTQYLIRWGDDHYMELRGSEELELLYEDEPITVCDIPIY